MENGNNLDEMLGKVEEAAERGAEKGAKKAGRRGSIISIAVSIAVVVAILIGGYFLYTKITGIFSLDNLLAIENGIEDHDLAIEDNGIFGYTAADFEEAILGKTEQQKKLEVYSCEVSDVAELIDTGFANLKVFTKCKMITYHGVATYTVDLSKVKKSSIEFDEENKVITLYIPHAVREELTIPSKNIEFGDTNKGLLAWGDIEATPEALAEVQTVATKKMEEKLEETKQGEQADKFAKLSVWEIYQPIVKGVSKEYVLEVEIED